MTEGFSRASTTGQREPASIVAVDVQSRTAQAMLRSKYTVTINCAYPVGDSLVTPAIGEQWYIERFDMEWRLSSRIPFNDPTQNIEPEEGQVSVGSAGGPLELNGTEMRLHGVLRLSNGTYLKDDGTHLMRSDDGQTWEQVALDPPSSTDDLAEGTVNLYFTDDRAADAAPVQMVAGKTGNVSLAKVDVGLGNVDNTSDAQKNAAVANLTNKTISGTSNTIVDVSQDAVVGLSTSLDSLTSGVNSKVDTTDWQDLFDQVKGSAGGGIADLIDRIQHLNPTGAFDAANLANLENIPAIAQTKIDGLTTALNSLLDEATWQNFLDNIKGGSGGVIADVVNRLQHLTATGGYDAASLTNVNNIPAIAQTKITGLTTALASLLPTTTWQSLLDGFRGSSGGTLTDVINRIQNLNPGTGVLGVPGLPAAIPDTNVPGVGQTLDSLFNGFLGFLGVDAKAGASHTQANDAINNQREVATSAVSAVTQIAAALAANNSSVDDFERINPTGLGPRWTILTNGAAGAWATPNGHDAEYTGNADYENLCIYDTIAAADTASVSMVLASAATFEPFVLASEFGSNDLWLRVANTTASFAARTGLRLRFRSDGLVTIHWFQAGVATQLASTTVTRPGSGATLSFAAGVDDNPRKFLATINGQPLFNGPVEDTASVTSFGPNFRKRGHGVRAENLALAVTARPGRLQQWMTEDSLTFANNLFGSVGNYRTNLDTDLVNQSNQAITSKVAQRVRQPEWASPMQLSDVTYPWVFNWSASVFGATGAQTAGTAHTHPINGTADASSAMWSVNQNTCRGGYITASGNYIAKTVGFACNTDAAITTGKIWCRLAWEREDGSITDPWEFDITGDVTTTTKYFEGDFAGVLDGMIMRQGERVLVWFVNTTNTVFRLMGYDINVVATPPSGWYSNVAGVFNKTSFTAAEALTANQAGTILPWIMIGSEDATEEDRTITDDFNRANLGPLWAQFADNVNSLVITNVNTTDKVDGRLTMNGTADDLTMIVCIETTSSDRMRADIDVHNLTDAGVCFGINCDRDLYQGVILTLFPDSAILTYLPPGASDSTIVANIDMTDQNNNGKWSLYYDVDLNKYVGMKNGVAVPGLSWTDTGHAMPRKPSCRYALLGIWRESGVLGGQLDNFVFRDWKP